MQRTLRAVLLTVVASGIPAAAHAASPAPTPLGLPRATLVLGGSTSAQSGSTSRAALIDAATKAVRANAVRLGVDALDILVADSVTPARYGPAIVTFRQERAKLPVYGARITAALDGAGTVRALTGGFSPKGATAAKTTFKLDAPAAILALLRNSGIAAGTSKLQLLAPRHGYDYFALATKSFVAARPVRIRAEYFPAVDRFVAAYYVELVGRRAGADALEGWGAVVSAESGELLRWEPLTHEFTHKYRVYADATGTPFVDAYGNMLPHPTARRDGWLPTTPAPMSLVTLDHAGISTGDPWLPAGATHTVGNNVDAFFNGGTVSGGLWTGDGYGPEFVPPEGDFRAPRTSAGTFDYHYDATLTATDYVQRPGWPATPIPTASTQLNAKIVQAFYASNWLHDLFYDLGFDESSGNAQKDNFGRGGLDGDPLAATVSFATWAYTPADGERPQISLGVNSTSRSARDPSGFDFTVLAHEWAHVLFGRLVPVGTGPQRGALNEGTADVVGVLLTARESHRGAAPGRLAYGGAYGVGAYFNRDYDFPLDTLPAVGTGGVPDDTYFHGVRRYPYTSDLALNPLTLRHVDFDNPVPAGSAPFDWKYRSRVNSEVHSAGEVWASAVWQCARNILADESRFTFDERRLRVLAYVVAGLKLFPADADFVTARNALLFAVRAADSTDYGSCLRGFAVRGFGAGAVAPPVATAGNRGVVESFSTSDAALGFTRAALAETGGGDGDGVLDVGEMGRLTVTLRNTGLAPLNEVRVQVPALPGAYAFPSGSVATGIALQPNEERSVSFPVSIVSTSGAQMLLFNLTATDDARADVYGQTDGLFTVNYDLRRDAYTDWLVSDAAFAVDWSAGFEPGHGCTLDCYGELTNWRRTTHLGAFGYRIGSDHVSLDAHLSTRAFRVAAAAPLRVTMTHDYALTRTPRFGGAATGTVEFSAGGGPWQSVAPYLIAGAADYTGASGGWRTDTLDFGTAFAGQTLQLRWRAVAPDSWAAQPVHWALSRVTVAGASTPVFSTMYVDVR